MSLDDFYNLMKVRIDWFTSHWREMHSMMPRLWPIEQTNSDKWLDEFIAYLQDRQDTGY